MATADDRRVSLDWPAYPVFGILVSDMTEDRHNRIMGGRGIRDLDRAKRTSLGPAFSSQSRPAGPSPGISIRNLEPKDWPAVRRIYLEGIRTGNATFETSPPPWNKWDASHLPFARFVAVSDGEVAGFAALSPISSRRVYVGVVEASVYVGARHRGIGAGSKLVEKLIEASEEHGVWTLQAGIFPENEASLGLFKRSGFKEVGRRERIGRLAGRWRDVCLLERRSLKVGVLSRSRAA